NYNVFFFSSRRRHTRFSRDWSSDVCSSDLVLAMGILYMLLMRGSLVREGEEGKGKPAGRSTMRELIRDYRLTGRARRLALRPDRSEERRVGKRLGLRARRILGAPNGSTARG